MQTEYFISIDEFCANHEIEISFIQSLQQSGLIEMTSRDERLYLEAGQLPQLEKIICLYYELDINLEGIETITHLLQRINSLQDEVTILRNRLRFYEDSEL